MCSLSRSSTDRSTSSLVALAMALHPGFLILDAIHFQYNGFLFGIMIWSLVGAREVGLALMYDAYRCDEVMASAGFAQNPTLIIHF